MSSTCVDVEKLYARDDKLKREDVEILQEWLKKQPHLPRLEETQVVLFLHSCYYRTEAVKEAIDKYFTIRTHHPDIFEHQLENSLRKTLSVGCIKILPKTTPEEYVVLMMQLIDFKADNFNFLHLVSVTNMVAMLHLHQCGFDAGAVALFDAKGFSFGHLARLNLTVLKCAMDYIQEGAPVRIKGIHFINVSPVLDKVMVLLKPMLKSELYNMIQFHSSMDTLYDYVPKNCLPEEYGGEAASSQILQERNLENLLKNFDFFNWHDSQKVDESKRMEKSNANSIFGTEGTFKKLQLD